MLYDLRHVAAQWKLGYIVIEKALMLMVLSIDLLFIWSDVQVNFVICHISQKIFLALYALFFIHLLLRMK